MIRTPHVSLAFRSLSIPEKVIFGRNIIRQLTNNVATFATPDVTVAALTTLTDGLENAARDAAMGDHQKVAAMHIAEKNWDTSLVTEAHYVDRIANGNQSTITLSGYTATASETLPSLPPASPANVGFIVSQTPGAGNAQCDVVNHATTYMFFISNASNPIMFNNNSIRIADNAGIIAFQIDTHRKVSFSNLPSGTQLYLSVIALNSAGVGESSAPVAFKVL